MQVHVFDTAKKASLAAAQLFYAELLKNPCAVLGLATGSTPIDTYRQLILWHKEGMLDFSKSQSFNLDEYVGLTGDHPCSYRRYMDEQLFNHINLKATHVPNGVAEDLKAECRRYDRAIEKAGGIDIQFLGIGQNGHIGFDEPAPYFTYGTQVVNLSDSTIDANLRFFSSRDEVPRQAISLGMGGIMQAKTIVLVALGKAKAEAIKAMSKQEVNPQVPASILRLHQNCLVLLDREAASLL